MLLAMFSPSPEAYADGLSTTINCSVSIYGIMGWDAASPGSFSVHVDSAGLPVDSRSFSYFVGAPPPGNCASALQGAERYALARQNGPTGSCTLQRDYDIATACNGQ